MSVRLITLGLFIFLYHISSAQAIRLKISVITSGKDSLTNATIQVHSVPDSLLLQSQISNAHSNTFLVAPFAKYFVKVSAIGFETRYKTITIANKPLSVTIELTAKSNTLDTVKVVEKKPLIKQEDDKTIVDAEVLANSSTNAYEILEKTPGTVVDQDGNAYLNGSTPASIYINGREMKMSTNDIATILKSLPAGSVSKIEIIRTPSAKYDAASSGGIINVVLKKGINIGTTGSVNARYDRGEYGTISSGFSIYKGIGKINSYFSYQYTSRNYYEDIQSNRDINVDTLLMQKSSIKYSTKTNYISGGIDYAFNKQFNISNDLRLTANSNSSNGVSENEFSSTNIQNEFFKSQTPIINKGNGLLVTNTLSSKYKIDSLGSEWNNEFDYTYSKNNNTQSYTNNFLVPDSPVVTGNGNNSMTSEVFALKSDLSLKLKYKFLLETGVKLNSATNKNNGLYYKQTGNSPQQVDPDQTSQFSYTEKINAAYLQLTKTFRILVLKAGLRFENTNMMGRQFIPTGNTFSINRNDLFPYFYIKRPLFKVLGYQLIGNVISRRSIYRPGYGELNPSPQFIDPFTFNVGNPKLQPQFTTNNEINATYNDFPVFALGTNDSKNVWSPVTYQDDTTKIAYRTYDNLGEKKEVYGRLFGGLPAGGRYFMYAGAQFNLVHYLGEYQGLPLNYERTSWTFFTGHELKATPTLRFNLNAWMYVNGFRAFNQLKTMGQLNLSITKTLMNKKLSIVASGNDILKTNKSIFHLQQGSVLINGTRIQDSRRIGLTIRYNFGIPPKEEKKEPVNQLPVNMDANQ